jgi:hypothetical protein
MLIRVQSFDGQNLKKKITYACLGTYKGSPSLLQKKLFFIIKHIFTILKLFNFIY